jgi:hypothetical protein
MPWMGFEPTIPLFEWAKIILWTWDQPVSSPLPNTNTEWTLRHQSLEWDSNSQSHCLREQKYFFGLGISPSQIRYLTQTQNERTQTSMPWMGFEPTIPLLEWAKIFLGTGDQPVSNPLPNTNTKWTQADIHALNGIRTHNPIVRVSENISLDGGSARLKSAT